MLVIEITIPIWLSPRYSQHSGALCPLQESGTLVPWQTESGTLATLEMVFHTPLYVHRQSFPLELFAHLLQTRTYNMVIDV